MKRVPRQFPIGYPRAPGPREQGAALIVGLILLMVLTVLAISTMRTATLELLMAGNAQYRENAFRIAEAGLASQVRQLGLDTAALDAAPDCPAPGDPELPPGPAVAVPALQGSYTTRLCLRGPGSFADMNSVDKVAGYHFQLTADSATEQRGARSRLVQGLYQLAPAAP